METIADRLKKQRKKADLTQAQVAKRLGINLNTYSRHEKNATFTCDEIFSIAMILKVPAEHIIYGEGVTVVFPDDEKDNETSRLHEPKPNFDVKNEIIPTHDELNRIKIMRRLSPEADNKLQKFLKDNI